MHLQPNCWKSAGIQQALLIVSPYLYDYRPRQKVCVIVCERKMSPARVTHPFSVQQKVDSEDHTVIHRNLLISVQDLKYPAEHGAVVNPRRAEAAFLWCGAQQQTRYAISSTVVSSDSLGCNSELCHNVQRENTTKHFRTLMNIDGAKTNQGLNYGLFI